MNFNLDALKNVTLETVIKPTKVAKVKTPKIGDIKVFKNGSIFYSEEFHKHVMDSGLDFINATEWNMYKKQLEVGAPKCVFICITPLSEPKLSAKVDVRTRKPEDTGVVAGVKKNLIPMLQELYGLDSEFDSVELKVNFDYALPESENNIYYIPKAIVSGADKGKPDSVRRENVTFWPLTIVSTDPEVIPEAEIAEEVVSEEVVTEVPIESVDDTQTVIEFDPEA